MSTGEDGVATLTGLDAFTSVVAYSDAGEGKYTWELPTPAHTYPAVMHALRGAQIRLAYPLPTFNGRASVSLWKTKGNCDFFDMVSISEEGYLTIAGLPTGEYTLTLKEMNTTIELRVFEGTHTGTAIFGESKVASAANFSAAPLHLGAPTVEGTNLRVRVYGATPSTRVHLVCTRAVPTISQLYSLRTKPLQESCQEFFAPKSFYLGTRRLGDEHKYILARQDKAPLGS